MNKLELMQAGLKRMYVSVRTPHRCTAILKGIDELSLNCH